MSATDCNDFHFLMLVHQAGHRMNSLDLPEATAHFIRKYVISLLFGRPIIECEQCSVLGTASDMILANLKDGYILATKGGTQFDISMHVRFIYDESVFRFVNQNY